MSHHEELLAQHALLESVVGPQVCPQRLNLGLISRQAGVANTFVPGEQTLNVAWVHPRDEADIVAVAGVVAGS